MSSPSPETDRNITAFFGSRESAEHAVARLVETGIPRDRILLRTGAARKPGCVEEDGKGLLQEVKELILPSEEPDSAVEALKHEGFLLSVRPDAAAHDDVFRSLEQDGGKGVESREDIWPDWKSGQDRSNDERETADAGAAEVPVTAGPPDGRSDAPGSAAAGPDEVEDAPDPARAPDVRPGPAGSA